MEEICCERPPPAFSPNPVRFFDVHTHVQFAAFKDDRKEVLERALKNDVWVVNVGTQRDTSESALELAEKYPEGVWAAVGLHPIHAEKSYHDAQELGAAPQEQGARSDSETRREPRLEFYSRREEFDYGYYKKLAENHKVVAIGECGLDYYRLSADTKKKQKEIFEKQIALSNEIKKPLMVHCREAFADLIEILSEQRSSVAGIVHFFSGTTENAGKLMDLGFSFSFGGVLTFARDYDKVVKYIPMGRVLLETDAPYVAPVPYRGKRNEPSYVIEVAKKIAEIKDLTLEEVAVLTFQNAERIFLQNSSRL
ncbi:MAG: Hydrolase, TatD family [Candidatus Adlerbacteria bacterium GW2011_GWC1_50_9]|uniref:Hydrolase, TatD family n=1 Tax=Candidatus Adlerbacteria bacterium GW2011_GWC1_50_9 TaxID=1618608 RepID=A0A0G1WNI8_9BACT|nr:MAG: Hydrolase, TatD family [Candidatus Adlerbacteria bacterium GW2011_GWC1_50_9]